MKAIRAARMAESSSASSTHPSKAHEGHWLLIEVTHTYHADIQTGIQRVVRNIVRELAVLGPALGLEVVPVVAQGGRFFAVPIGEVLRDKVGQIADARNVSRVERLKSPFRPAYRATLRMLARLLPFPAARRFIYAPHYSVGVAWLLRLPVVAVERAVRSLSTATPFASDGIDDIKRVLDRTGRPVTLLLLDASWNVDVWSAVKRLRTIARTRVASVIYDLIPITHPHMCDDAHVAAFSEWMRGHASNVDTIIGISKTVRDEIADHLARTSPAQPPTVGYFYLGCELDLVDPTIPVASDVQRILDDPEPTFLMVGSLEPKKNHLQAYEAFVRLWNRGIAAKLVIVGRQGWKTESLQERMQRDGRFGSRLHILRNATDRDLEALYSHSAAVIMSSEVEGFGLPLVEARVRRTPVICSDIPVFRELADPSTRFFPLHDADALARTIETFLASPPSRESLESASEVALSWRESALQLAGCLPLSAPPRGPVAEDAFARV